MKLVLFLAAQEGQEEGGVMSNDESQLIWNELDNYRQGKITGDCLQRWMAEEANFNLPSDEAHYLNGCFGGSNCIT